MTLGDYIKQYRDEHELSQRQFALQCGLSNGYISMLERGENPKTHKPIKPTLEKLNAVARAMGTTFNDLVSAVDEMEIDLREDTLASGKVVRLQPESAKIASSLSDEAVDIAKRYSALDKHGKTVVNVVLTEEEKRMAEEKKRKRAKKYEEYDEAGESTGRVIPLYYSPSAAGYASPAFGEDFEYIEVGGDVPAHADFAVRIDGDSMEPYIMDGSTVYVNRDPLANGDVGIFFFDGDMLCKQYYRDEWGNVNLLSLNRKREDADRFIEEDSDLTLVCYGRVILPHPIRLAVPEDELL